MTIFNWVILGLIAGFVASKLVNRQGSGLLMDIAIGITGALLGGLLFDELGLRGLSGFTLWSFFVAISGAVILLVLVNLFSRSR